jgi:hypothetical protein
LKIAWILEDQATDSMQSPSKSVLTCIWNHKRLPKVKAILNKKSNGRGMTTPDFKLYYWTMVTKVAWYWNKKSHVNQRNRIEDPKVSTQSYNYSHLIFYKGAKNLCWRKDSYYNKWYCYNRMHTCKILKQDLYFLLCTKSN